MTRAMAASSIVLGLAYLTARYIYRRGYRRGFEVGWKRHVEAAAFENFGSW